MDTAVYIFGFRSLSIFTKSKLQNGIDMATAQLIIIAFTLNQMMPQIIIASKKCVVVNRTSDKNPQARQLKLLFSLISILFTKTRAITKSVKTSFHNKIRP